MPILGSLLQKTNCFGEVGFPIVSIEFKCRVRVTKRNSLFCQGCKLLSIRPGLHQCKPGSGVYMTTFCSLSVVTFCSFDIFIDSETMFIALPKFIGCPNDPAYV